MNHRFLKKVSVAVLTAAMGLTMTTAAFAGEAAEAETVDKSTLPRIIITTDLEVDDQNGLLLSLLYSTDYDLAGIVHTAGQFHFTGDGEHTLEEITPNYRCEATTAGGAVEYAGQLKEFRPVEPGFLERIITVSYAKDYEKLSQNNPNYPTPEYLMSIAKEGNVQFEGDYREETEGSQLIYDCIMDDDPRELVIQHWGGINTTVRALYSIYEDYHDTDEWDAVLEKVVNKVRLSGHGEDNCFEDSGIAEMFPGLQDVQRDGYAGVGNYFQPVMIGEGALPFIGTSPEINSYYQAEYLQDAFKFNTGMLMGEFHLMGDGQVIYGEPYIYQYGLITYIDWATAGTEGWGPEALAAFPRIDLDRYDWMCCQFGCNSYVDLGLRQGISHGEDHYTAVMMEDIAARAQWAVNDPENCNHAPVVTAENLDITAKAGETIALSGSAEDPDGNELTATWWIPDSSCTYGKEEGESDSTSAEAANEEAEPAEEAASEGESAGEEAGDSEEGESTGEEAADSEGDSSGVEAAPALSVTNTEGWETEITIPENAQSGDIIVVNLEVKDTGVERPMTRFAQFIITVE